MALPADISTMPVEPGGLATAAAQLADQDGAAELAAEQADLFDGSALLAAPQMADVKRGRPAGAQNRTTREWAAFILKHYRSPLLALADIMTADPFALHAAIIEADKAANLERSVSLKAVLDLQRAAAEALAGYVHRRQPVAIDGGEDKELPSITFVLGAGATVAGPIAEALGAQGIGIDGPVEVAGDEVAAPAHDG